MASTFTSDTLPADHKAAIRQMKHALRAQLGDVQQIFNQLSDDIATRVAEINALKAQGDAVWPVLSYADIKAGHVTADQREQIKRRGCAVIKGHFPREQALGWDQSMLDYLDRNRFDEVYKGPGDNFFGTLSASRPEIYPIYWSQAQMQARQSEEMANAQSFLNRLWTFESDGKQWFNPDVSVIYPDRIRRRPPGTTSKGLGAHTDSGALERWLLPAYQRVFANVLMAIWRNMIPGMRHIVRKLKSTRWTTPPNVPCFGHSRAGQRSLICCLVRGCCTSCPFLKPWRTYCYVRCLMMCRRMNCAA